MSIFLIHFIYFTWIKDPQIQRRMIWLLLWNVWKVPTISVVFLSLSKYITLGNFAEEALNTLHLSAMTPTCSKAINNLFSYWIAPLTPAQVDSVLSTYCPEDFNITRVRSRVDGRFYRNCHSQLVVTIGANKLFCSVFLANRWKFAIFPHFHFLLEIIKAPGFCQSF